MKLNTKNMTEQEIKEKAYPFIKESGLDELDTDAFVQGALWMQNKCITPAKPTAKLCNCNYPTCNLSIQWESNCNECKVPINYVGICEVCYQG